MHEKCRSYCLLPSTETVLLRPDKVWAYFYFEREKGREITAFKGTIRFFKVVEVLSLGPRHALMTVVNPLFS
jgi:hypothetical protein